jgi:hypothetical protein
MDDISRIKTVSAIDVVVAIFLILTGIFVISLSMGIFDLMSLGSTSYSSINPYSWFGSSSWIILMLGIATLIYAIKRIIDDILKMVTPRNQQYYQEPYQQP